LTINCKLQVPGGSKDVGEPGVYDPELNSLPAPVLLTPGTCLCS